MVFELNNYKESHLFNYQLCTGLPCVQMVSTTFRLFYKELVSLTPSYKCENRLREISSLQCSADKPMLATVVKRTPNSQQSSASESSHVDSTSTT